MIGRAHLRGREGCVWRTLSFGSFSTAPTREKTRCSRQMHLRAVGADTARCSGRVVPLPYVPCFLDPRPRRLRRARERGWQRGFIQRRLFIEVLPSWFFNCKTNAGSGCIRDAPANRLFQAGSDSPIAIFQWQREGCNRRDTEACTHERG